jgi:hypothetical protein
MKKIRWIVAAMLMPLLAVQSYVSAKQYNHFTHLTAAEENGFVESLEQYNSTSGYRLSPDGHGGMQIFMQLPDDFGAYAEVFGRTNLLEGQWKVLDGWIPTYGSSELTWDDAVRTNVHTFFYMIYDATIDYDGDGYSDWREHYISLTDPESFDSADYDGDGLHDYWEIKLFGDIWTQDGDDDSDGDGLPNKKELVWLEANTIRMYSDPSICDTDGDGLDDGVEQQIQIDPLSVDTDADGRNDAFEVLGSPPTDPNNPDVIAPVLVLAGG